METELSTAVAGTRKKRGEGHTRRDEILSAAKKLFLREGYQATTIRRIADEVGVSAPALYLYFRDKEAIMVALCDQTFGFLLESISRLENEPLPPLEQLRHCGEAYVRFGLENPQEYWLTFLSGAKPKQIRLHDKPLESIDPNEPGATGAIAFGRLVNMLKTIEQAGTPLNYPADTAAELVWMSLHGLVAAMINNPDFASTKQDPLIAAMIDMLVRGVVKAA